MKITKLNNRRGVTGLALLTGLAVMTAQAAKPGPEEEAKAAATAKVAAVKAAATKVAAAEKALEEARKASDKLTVDKEVEAIKATARKAAKERIASRLAAIKIVGAAVAAKDVAALKVFQESAFEEKIIRDKKAVAEAKTGTAAAEKDLAGKDADINKTEAAVKTAMAAAAKSPDDKELEKKASVARTAAEAALRSRNGALNTLRSRKTTGDAARAQVKSGEQVVAKLVEAKMLNNTYDQAVANAVEAKKTASERDAAAKRADNAARSARSAAKKKRDDKVLAQKAKATETSARKLVAERNAALKARGEADKKVVAAKRAADQVNSVINTFNTVALAEKIDQERRSHEKALADKAAAEKALTRAAAAAESTAARSTAAKASSDRGATSLAAAEKNTAARIAAMKAAGEKAAATLADTEKSLAKARKAEKKADKNNAAKAIALRKAVEKKLAKQVAANKKAVAKATVDRKVLEKRLASHAAGAKKITAAYTAARTTAEKAALATKAAAGNRALDETPIKDSLTRLYQAQSLVDGGLAPLPVDQWDYAKARHLLCRAGFGGTPREVRALHALGLQGAVEFMVDFHGQAALNLPFNAVLPERPVRDENRLDRQRRREMTNVRRRVESLQQNNLRDWWLKRMAQSPRQLEEKLALFWHGHFATEYRTVRSSYAMYQQNQLFREHAVGNFGALLHGIVQDPAMLRYLDNNSNIKGRPNENLAREIMELFSLGEGNYAEEDIMEGARALTGYTYDTNTSQFRFIVSRHDSENKTIFGRTGPWAGDDFVDLILRQPFTSRFIARKLFVYFTHENPDEEIVHRLASVLSNRQYELAPMLKNLFMSKEFYSDKSMATQIKNPVQLAIGTLRDLGIKDISYGTLGSAVAGMGQEIFGPPNVRGWEGGQFWVNSNRIFVRYNSIADLVERTIVPDQSRGLDIVRALENEKLETPDQVIDYLARSCLIQPLSGEKKQILVEEASSLPPSSDWESQRSQVNATLRAILVLMMSMPEYQCI